MELAVTVNCMEPFIKAMYNLEGDGFLALEVYEQVNALYIAITSKHMPNVKADQVYKQTLLVMIYSRISLIRTKF